MHIKYFSAYIPDVPSCRATDSMTWKRIFSIHREVAEHMFWKAGNGQIFFWLDAWLYSVRPFPPLILEISASLNAEEARTKVSDWWTEDNVWD